MLAICTLALLAARGNLCVARHSPNSQTGSVRHICEVLGFGPYFHLSRHSFTFRAFLRAFDRLLWARGAPKFVGDAAPIRPSFLNPEPVKTAYDRHEAQSAQNCVLWSGQHSVGDQQDKRLLAAVVHTLLHEMSGVAR